MKHLNFSFLALATLLLVGCKAKTAAEEKVAVPVAQAPAVVLSAEQRLGQKLKKEMPYAELRKTVLAEGWLPLVTPECKENVGGEALICDTQPELEACSGDGHCNMQFAHGKSQTKLRVGTYAENTKFWEFSSDKNNDNTIACPSQKFEDFLKRFAGDGSVQAAFTLPLIKVEELVDDEEKGYSMRSVYFNKADYRDFNLAYLEDGFHAVFNGDIGPKLIPVEIKQENADSYFVKFVYGMSEGNSYRFQKNAGCWYLGEDPEAPSP
jgi:hypothetical protein